MKLFETEQGKRIKKLEADLAGFVLSHKADSDHIKTLETDAARYRFLRGRDLRAIGQGGVFAGMTPDNIILNGADLDKEIDKAMKA